MSDTERADLLARMYAGEDVCRLQCVCADLMKEHTFYVEIAAPTREQAAQVMAERLQHDEDYGFPYEIKGWR